MCYKCGTEHTVTIWAGRTDGHIEIEELEETAELEIEEISKPYDNYDELYDAIAEYFKPEEIIGKEVLLLANLAPRTIRGVESKGMILMADSENGKLSFVSPQDAWPVGFSVK